MMDDRIKLFDASTIETVAWPATADGEYAKKFLVPLIKNGVSHYIDNIETNLLALSIDDLVLPITINDSQYMNCYVCSPYGQYVTYAQEYIEKIKNNWVKRPLLLLVSCMGKMLRLGEINKVVVVNNWLFSINLYPHITQEQVSAIKSYLQKRFPAHAILFRSIHTYGSKALYKTFEHNHFSLIASRPIYFLKTHDESVFSSRIFKSDYKLLRESTHEVVSDPGISFSEAQQITSLYQSVYLERHSMLNPQWNVRFVELAFNNKILNLKALRKNGRIEAVAGYYCRNGMMTSPFLGYDISLPVENKLYRLTCTVLTQEARDRKLLFHLSSGASFFKKIRKAEASIEYMAVCHKHLPFLRRVPWVVLRGLSNTLGIAFMKRFD